MQLLVKTLDQAELALDGYDSKLAYIALRDAAFYRGVVLGTLPRLSPKKATASVGELQLLTDRMRALSNQFMTANLKFT